MTTPDLVPRAIRTLYHHRLLQSYGRLLVVGLVGLCIGAASAGIHFRPTSAHQAAEASSQSRSSKTAAASLATNQTAPYTPTQPPTTPTMTVTPPTISTVPAPSAAAPPLSKATEDPTLAWDDQYQYLTTDLGQDAANLDTILYPCSTINPDYNSLCAPYDGSGALPACQKLLTDTTTAQGVPPVPYAAANSYWQSALAAFQSSAQTCITRINAHATVGIDTDVGYAVKTNYAAGVQDLESMSSELTQYIQQLANRLR